MTTETRTLGDLIVGLRRKHRATFGPGDEVGELIAGRVKRAMAELDWDTLVRLLDEWDEVVEHVRHPSR